MLVLARRERVFVVVACSTYSPRGIECVCACVIKINSKYTNIPNENKIGITVELNLRKSSPLCATGYGKMPIQETLKDVE